MRRFVAGFALLVLQLLVLPGTGIAAPVLGDVTFERKTKGDEEFAPAVFPHWVHRVRYKCYVCHNKEMGFGFQRGSVTISMDSIDNGKHCGACHKGETAFGISFETCNRCHRK